MPFFEQFEVDDGKVRIQVVEQRDQSVSIVREALDANAEYRPSQQITLPKAIVHQVIEALGKCGG